MAKDPNPLRKREKTKTKLSSRLTVPMLLVVIFQLVIFFAILIIGGEFRYVEEYAYRSLDEKTENRRNYIESELQSKAPYVQEYAERIDGAISELLARQGATVADLQTDADLDRSIMESSVDTLISLLRRSAVNDVFLILDTGELYNERSTTDTKASLYLRDLDPKTDAGYEDLLMEVGLTSISRDFGIVLDSGWSLHFMPDPNNPQDYDFYYRTLDVARENSDLSQKELGYWSGFSSIAGSGTASMKYSIPLIADDGTVYGVVGIGLTEKTILSELPANDFLSETACYVLGYDNSDDVFDIVTRSGASFTRLIGDAEVLPVFADQEDGLVGFSVDSDVDLVGSVQYIDLYGETSPFYAQRWALISVADRASVMSPLTSLVRLLLISSLVSLLIGVVIVLISTRAVARPITDAIKVMNENRKYSQVIRFQPSNIFELDRMTDAITQLQINVRDFSSQVSRMISVADVGMGTFLYDRSDNTVFVGQSLLKLFQSDKYPEQDIVLSRQEFLDRVVAKDIRSAVAESLELTTDKDQADFTRVCSLQREDGSTVWLRLSTIYTPYNSIGILQDITDTMMEKKRIEFERDYDSFTGLLNRRAYYERVEELFHEEKKHALGVTGFVMIDLDNLKYVNDTYGHDFGDEYIKAAAIILKKFQNYGGIVAHISGDEFTVCLPGFGSKDEIRQIINNVRDQLLQGSCLLADGTHFRIRASIGVSWYPDDSQSYEALMKYADFAMYTLKHSTKGEIAEFDINSYTTDSVLLTGVEEMNRIIDERSVKYAFQSIISAKTGEVYGYEALMRIQSNIFQSPLELLRTAKTGARLYEIERMTWLKALDDFRVQIDAGHVDPASRIFVNSIGSCVLDQADMDALETAHPELLSQVVLEVLESENVDEDFIARKTDLMKQWRAQVALDDFGTGYNSEYALITIQPHIVKIDRSIISGCDKDVSRRMIINSLVRLARTKNILVLAEGVETEEELRTVISCGVDLLQGYYFCHPLFEPQPIPPEIVETIKRMSNPRPSWSSPKEAPASAQ